MAAEIQNHTQQTKPRSNSCFLIRCFGFSSEEVESGKVLQSNDNRKNGIGLLCWSKFRMKKSGIKTVPIIDTTTEKTADHHHYCDNKVDTHKSKMKWLSYVLLINKRQKQSMGNKSFDEISAVPEELVEVKEVQEPEQKSTVVENRKSFEDTGQKRLSFLRRTDAKRSAGSSEPGSPDVKPKPSRNSNLFYSVSLPPALNSPSQTRVKPKKTKQNNNAAVKKFDPLVGMSFIIVILIITLIWGRLCAILCTSAWFYFISRFRSESKISEDRNTSGDLDLNSEEYKKKVVLEGFLERNHRTTAF